MRPDASLLVALVASCVAMGCRREKAMPRTSAAPTREVAPPSDAAPEDNAIINARADASTDLGSDLDDLAAVGESTPVAAPRRQRTSTSTIPLHGTREIDGPDFFGFYDLVAAPDGAVLVYLFASGGRSYIGAWRIGVDGRFSGLPRLLHSLTEPMTALDADLSQGRLWVAWTTSPGSLEDFAPIVGEQRVYALVVDADLARASRPITLSRFRARPVPRPWQPSSVQIRGMPDGGAVATSAGPSRTCARAPCPGWSTHTVRPDGTHRTHTEGLLDGARLPWALTHTQDGVVGLVASGPDGRTTHLRSVVGPRSAGEGTYLGTSGASLAFDGARLVMIAGDVTERSVGSQLRVVAWGGTTGDAPAQGAWEHSSRVTAHTLRCVRGRPVVRYAWQGGYVDLDPGRAGTNFDLLAHLPDGAFRMRDGAGAGIVVSWTGRVVVGVDQTGGHLNRWSCDRNALVEER